MRYEKNRFRLNRSSHEIIHTHIVSNRLVGRISESELRDLVEHGELDVFINAEHDQLELVSPDLHAQFMMERWADHIATSGDVDYDDFTDGYYFYAERWKGADGRSIVILYYHH